jgi:peptidoglycan/LPS O-acetylase OafA/YrhL
VFIPVLVLTALVIGALIGAWRARRRGGKVLDMLQYAAAHAIPLMILALFVTIFLDRAGH